MDNQKPEMVIPKASVMEQIATLPAFSNNKPPRSSRPSRTAIIVVASAGVVILVALVFVYVVFLAGKTAYGRSFQDRVWQHFVDKTGVESLDTSVTVSYTDTGHFEFVPSKVVKLFEPELPNDKAKEYDTKYGFSLDGLKTTFGVSGFGNFTDVKNPKLDGQVLADITNNGGNYSGSVAGKIQNKTGFAKYDYSDSIANSTSLKDVIDNKVSDHKGKWLKFLDPSNTTELDKFSKSISLQGNLNSKGDDAVATEAQNNEIRSIWKKHRPLKIKSFKGITIMNGKPVIHYDLELDKDSIKAAVQDSVKLSMGDSYNEQKAKFATDLTNIVIDKIQVSQYEVWIGILDKKVYKSVTVSNALSVTKMADTVYQKIISGDFSKALGTVMQPVAESFSDAKRVADMRQLSSIMELYYNDLGGYPAASNGKPVGLATTYIQALPESPQPAQAPCTDYNNTYWYAPSGDVKEVNGGKGKIKVYSAYSYAFCLSSSTGGIQAGPNTLTPSGISGQTSDSAGQIHSSDSNVNSDPSSGIEKLILDIYRSLPWDAQIRIESTNKNYGKDRSVDLPKDFVDVTSSTPSAQPLEDQPQTSTQ